MDDLKSRLESHLGRPVLGLAALGGGACQENFRVQIASSDGPERMVLRSDARSSLPGSIGRKQEFAVIAAAVSQGVPTPPASHLAKGLVRDSAWAYLMPERPGEAIGRRVVSHPRLGEARERLPEQLATALAAVHRVTPESHPDLPLTRSRQAPTEAALSFLEGIFHFLPEPHPVLEYGLRWARDHAPEPSGTTLVHGDFRTGNFLVTEQGLSAVLDWEFAHWGDPMDDLGWLCVRDWRFGQLALPAGGLASRERFYSAYEVAAGRPVDPDRVRWWELIGNLRWGGAAVFQGERYLSGKSRDLEMLAIPRRVCEMEWEVLRLIEGAG